MRENLTLPHDPICICVCVCEMEWAGADFIEGSQVWKLITSLYHILMVYTKSEKLDIRHPVVGTFSFSLALLTSMLALILLLPHFSFSFLPLLYLSLADYLWKLTSRRKKRSWDDPQLFFWNLPIIGYSWEKNSSFLFASILMKTLAWIVLFWNSMILILEKHF